jgi:hypothetical protein
MRGVLVPYITGVAVVGVSLIAGPRIPDIVLISGGPADSPLGGGTALVLGTSGNPMPPEIYADAIDQLYFQPRGFTGTTEILYTPEGLYPATGVKSLPLDTSEAQDEHILEAAIQNQIAGGGVDAANPIVVFGWSQSADITGPVMHQLAAQGVPNDDVHFVLVGDANNPDGGLLERFDVPAGSSPSVPSLGITFSGATPSDLYPTDIYTNEYDGFADFPRYPIDFLSDLNAYLGIAFDHTTYPVLQPEQIGDAIALPTSAADTMTNYYMIPENLPLLDPLRFIPVIGNPLADLLQPDLSVLVNLGYGSIANGWSPGPADVPTPFGLFPPASVLEQVPQALANGVPQGITAAIHDLQDPANYQIIPSVLDNPLTNQFISLAHVLGYTDATNLSSLLDFPSLKNAIPNLLEVAQSGLSGFAGFPVSDATLLSSPTDIIDDLTGTVSADYATLLPAADTLTALLTTLPAYDASLFTDQLQAGNLLDAVGDPFAADLALVPFAIGFGTALPILEAAGGTLLNLVDLALGT